jgi:hypothetical protein
MFTSLGTECDTVACSLVVCHSLVYGPVDLHSLTKEQLL